MIEKGLACLLSLWSAPFALSAPDAGSAGSLPKEDVYRVVHAHFGAIKSCYEEQLLKHPDLQGTVDVGWNIERDGSVSKVRLVNSTFNEKDVERCIVAEVATWRFATAPEQTVVRRFPFVFKSAPPVPPDAPKMTIWVSRAGVIELNGQQADLAAVKAAMIELGRRKGVVVYGQDQPDAHPIGGRVFELARQNKVLFRSSSRRDFSDAIGPDGKLKP